MPNGLHRPILSLDAVKTVLRAMQAASPLPPEHPLHFFLTVREQLEAPQALRGAAAAEAAIFGYVARLITTQLKRLRAPYGLPPPNVQCPQLSIREDFQQNNQELEAWSVLYHRYVCVGHNLQMQDIAALTEQDSRLLRRRRTLGQKRLMHLLIEEEQAARQKHAEQRLRLALPRSQPPTLIGRTALLEAAYRALCKADPPHHLLLYGPRGVGKSALAIRLAHHLIAEGCLEDAVWVEAETLATELSAALFEIATRLDLPLQGAGDFRGALRAYLDRHPTLIVLDGAEALAQAPGALDALTQALDMALVVLTSRVRPQHSATYTLAVSELSREQAFDFLAWYAEKHMPKRGEWEKHFDAIWEAVGGNPAALQAAFDATRSLPLQEALKASPVEPIYAQLWEQLPTQARRVWVLGLFFPRGEASYADLRELLRLPRAALHAALRTLTDAALLEARAQGRKTFYRYPPHVLPFLQQTVRRRRALSPEEDAHAFLQRLYPRRLAQLVRTPEARTALTLLRLAEEHAFDMVLRWRAAYELGPQITQAGLWTSWQRVLEALAQHAHSAEQHVWLQWMLGIAARWLGQLPKAREHLQEALSLCVPQTSEYASIQVELGVLARYQGRWEETHRLLKEALAFFQKHHLYDGVERCVHELAQLELEVEQPKRALALLSRLQRRTARTWGIISQAHLQQGELSLAREAAEHVLALLPPQHPNRARTLATLGEIALARGALRAALDNLLLAVDQLEQARDILGYARACNNLAAVHLHLPREQRELRTEVVRHLLEEALRIQTYAEDEIGQAVSRRNLALLEDDERKDAPTH